VKFLILIGLPFLAVTAQAEQPVFASGPERTSLIQLYTSEGCSSCPPAEAWLAGLRNDPDLWHRFVPIAFHVTYWNYLGWTDVLATPAYTQRQYTYASAWGGNQVYTPCFVRDGEEWRPPGGHLGTPPSPGRLTVTLQPSSRFTVTYEPYGAVQLTPLEVHVARLGGGIVHRVRGGENRGATLTQEFVCLGIASARLDKEGSGTLQASLSLPSDDTAGVTRFAMAAWVTQAGRLEPLQATGGWLP
jgi:hypothetical protein